MRVAGFAGSGAVRLALAGLLGALLVPGCSLILDFGAGPEGAADGGGTDGTPDGGPTAMPCATGACFERPIALGDMFGCAIRGNRRVACWGSGRWGAMGSGSEADNAVPVEIASLADVVQVTAGYRHACALLESSEVWCWGYNTFGQLGGGATAGPDTCDDGGQTSEVDCSKVPVPVEGLPPQVVQIEAGRFYTCALSLPGRMHCWGNPQDGVLGNGMTAGTFRAAVEATLANDAGLIDMMAPGSRHSCVLLADGMDRIRCWGFQGNGRLGNGSELAEPVLVPQTVVQPNAGYLSSGEAQSCAALTNGAVRCWGNNDNYELGNNTTQSSPVPTDVVGAVATRRISVEAGDAEGHVVTVTAAGGAQCWGRNRSGECGKEMDPVTAASEIRDLETAAHPATGTYHSCAMSEGGEVWCWGGRTRCQIGDGDCLPGEQPTPVPIPNFP